MSLMRARLSRVSQPALGLAAALLYFEIPAASSRNPQLLGLRLDDPRDHACSMMA